MIVVKVIHKHQWLYCISLSTKYSIFQNVLITILDSNLHCWPPEFEPLHVVGEYGTNFYPWLCFIFSYQAANKASPAFAVF